MDQLSHVSCNYLVRLFVILRTIRLFQDRPLVSINRATEFRFTSGLTLSSGPG
jgi:hypothetical protein